MLGDFALRNGGDLLGKAHKTLARRTLSGHPGHRSSRSGTQRTRLMCLGFWRYHINLWPLDTRPGNFPPPTGQSPAKKICVFVPLSFLICGECSVVRSQHMTHEKSSNDSEKKNSTKIRNILGTFSLYLFLQGQSLYTQPPELVGVGGAYRIPAIHPPPPSPQKWGLAKKGGGMQHQPFCLFQIILAAKKQAKTGEFK